LVVDADAVRTCAIPGKLFETVPRWNAEVAELIRCVEDEKLAESRPLDHTRNHGLPRVACSDSWDQRVLA
jgi:hypothetical protein